MALAGPRYVRDVSLTRSSLLGLPPRTSESDSQAAAAPRVGPYRDGVDRGRRVSDRDRRHLGVTRRPPSPTRQGSRTSSSGQKPESPILLPQSRADLQVGSGVRWASPDHSPRRISPAGLSRLRGVSAGLEPRVGTRQRRPAQGVSFTALAPANTKRFGVRGRRGARMVLAAVVPRGTS